MAGVLLAWRDKVQGQPCAEPVEALLQGALEQLLAALERALAEKVASINRRAPCTSPFAQSPTSPAPNPQPSTYGFRSFQECSNVCMGHSSWVLHRTGREPPDGEPPSETLLRGTTSLQLDLCDGSDSETVRFQEKQISRNTKSTF